MATPRPPDAPSVVGRERERARVAALLAQLPGGPPRALVLRGAAGVGLSTLWWDGVEQARARGIAALPVRPAPEDVPLALVGADDLLRAAGGALDGASDVAGYARALHAALARGCAGGPVLLAIDDLAWLDPASARALGAALRRLPAAALGVLATLRDADDPLRLAADLGWPVEAVDVGPLPAPALRRVLAGTLPALPRPLLRRIAAASGGSTLHALEIARALAADAGAEPPERLPLPASLGAAMEARLADAPADLGAVLEVLAALGHATAPELAHALPDVDLAAALAAGRARGLLTGEAEDGAVRFAHPAIGTAVDARLPAARRRALHAALAARAADPDARARHLAIAAAGPDAAVAAALEAASERAATRGAADLAVELAARAFQLTPAADAADGLRRARREVELMARAGDAARAAERAGQLVARLPAGPLRAAAIVLRAQLGDDPAAALRALTAAAEEASGDPLAVVAVREELAFTRFLAFADVAGALADGRAAADAAAASGDATTAILADAGLAHLEGVAGRPRLDAIRRAAALDDVDGGPRRARVLLAKQLRWAGELAAARDACRVGPGDELARAALLGERALIEIAAGELAAAEALVREGLAATRDAGSGHLEPQLAYPQGLLAAARGDAGAARAAADAIAARAGGAAMRHERIAAARIRGLLALGLGDAATAARELEAAAALCASAGIRHPGVYPVLADAVEAVAGSRGPAAAAPLAARLAAEAATLGSVWAHATARRAAGVLALAEGSADDALGPLADAVAGLDACGAAPDAARALLVRGRALLRLGRPSDAVADLEQARRRLDRIGAAHWRERADEELARARRRPGAEGLTPTEDRIARLVADGLRNAEIAAALSLSVATVEAHLTRTYRKVDVRSRSELARLVADGRAGAGRPGRGGS